MSTLFAVRAPYPKIIPNVSHFPEPSYLFFVDTSDIDRQSFFEFYSRFRAAVRFLGRLRDVRGGHLRVLFGTSFEDAVKSVLVEEDADTLVLPREERGIVDETLCKVVYL